MPFYFNFETSMTFTRKIWMAFNLFELSLEVTSSRLMTFFFERIWNWAGESRLENKFDKLMMMGQWEMALIYLLIRLLHLILRVSNELLEVTSYWNLRDKNIEKRIIKKIIFMPHHTGFFNIPCYVIKLLLKHSWDTYWWNFSKNI